MVLAVHEAIDTLNHELTVGAKLLEGLRSTTPMWTIATDSSMAAERARLAHALDEIERAKHHARDCFFRGLHEEGITIGQIARLWGISRQLASRTIQGQAVGQGQA
jgi:hypothetical protein